MGKFSVSDIMNAKSIDSKEQLTFKIEHIDLDDIVRSEKNKYSLGKIIELAESIDAFGLFHNLRIRKIVGSTKYELISGERRYLALRHLVEQGKQNYRKAPCKVEQSMDDVKAELQLILANATARELTDYEKVYQVGRLKELLEDLKKSGSKIEGRIREVIADILDISSSQVEILESVGKNLNAELIEELKDGNLNITAAYNLSKLDTKQQQAIHENIKSGHELTSADVKQVRKELKSQDNTNTVNQKPLLSRKERVPNHILKCSTVVFEDITVELKTFEYRYNDRNYRIGDVLRLCEYDAEKEVNTGRFVDVEVTYILEGGKFGIPDGYVIMSIRKLSGVY